ncbi:hypothetical protein [Streptomyces sp. RPT161]|uniref:hypothetical protein n=1 Tax=Streptomyces sp. RPT161 TaxID=3015993 RepID=UPI0022B87633|nr:hypothetical protein [Streptomyces sp. RPT161]
MQPDDFFVSQPGGWSHWPLNIKLLEELRFGPLADHADLEVAVALTRLLIDDFLAKGTRGGERMDDQGVVLAIKGHRSVVERLGLEPPQWPFRHFSGFYDYWIANDMKGSWQARRECIEHLLGPTRDALEQLQEIEYESRFKKGPAGHFKNLIFAADGPKPKIVLRDAVNNRVEIVENAEYCLIYDRPLPPGGLAWRQLVAWWIEDQNLGVDEATAADLLYRRLFASLASDPERLVMQTYCARYAEPDGFELPALVPQVYLHYDPYTRKSAKHSGALARERMDFLLLTPDRSRIVIEVDGIQHYAVQAAPREGEKFPRWFASTQLYSDMVAEDRRLRLDGYEVFRFGGKELEAAGARQMLTEFFSVLLDRHQRPIL